MEKLNVEQDVVEGIAVIDLDIKQGPDGTPEAIIATLKSVSENNKERKRGQITEEAPNKRREVERGRKDIELGSLGGGVRSTETAEDEDIIAGDIQEELPKAA